MSLCIPYSKRILTRQPQGHAKLVKDPDLLIAIAPSLSKTNLVDSRGLIGSYGTSSAGVVMTAGGISFAGLVDYYTLPTNSDITILAVVDPATMSASPNPGLFRDDMLARGSSFFILDRATALPWMRWSGVDVLRPSSGTTVPFTKPYVIAYRVKQGVSADVWIDGALAHSHTTVPSSGVSFDIYHLGYQYDASENIGDIAGAFVWSRGLDDGEMQKLTTNPWTMFEDSQQPVYFISAASGTTGTLSTTNDNDSLTASGSPIIVGTLAKTNANDALLSSGTTAVVGFLSKTNAEDSLAASGAPIVTGSLAKTNANDTLVSSGEVIGVISGSLATTNANDLLASSGSTIVIGSLAKTNENDTLSATGEIVGVISGSLATTNANDTLLANGSPIVIGSLSKTNANDTLSSTGIVPSTGSVSYTNNDDSIIASGIVTGAVNLTPQDLLNIADAVWAHSSAVHFELLLTEAWGRLGLDPTAPLVSGQTQISFGTVVMALTQASGIVTATRQ